jgi:hypothetical protein
VDCANSSNIFVVGVTRKRMVKLKTICRTNRDSARETKEDMFRVVRSLNPNLH